MENKLILTMASGPQQYHKSEVDDPGEVHKVEPHRSNKMLYHSRTS